MTEGQQRIVIWEGPDMCGKTNIATAYSQYSCIPLYKNSGELSHKLDSDYFVNTLRYYETHIINFISKLKIDVMFDRSYPSEWVYSQAFNRKTDGSVLHFVDETYAKMNAKIILCRRTNYDGIKDDLHSVIDSEKLKRLDELYERFMNWTVCDCETIFVDKFYDEETLTYDVASQIMAVDRFLNS